MPESTIFVELTDQGIDAAAVRSRVMGDPALGGICTFEGATRNDRDPDHGAVVRLEYEAYDGMARKQMSALATEALERWGPGRAAVIHRTGAVSPGEVSVMIVVACGHRAEAFEACRWLIDTVKKDVPIWKRDVFEDGFERWVDPAGATPAKDG